MHIKPGNPYLSKHALYGRLLPVKFNNKPNITIVIPCHNEPDITTTLESLVKCEKPKGNAEVIVVVNHTVQAPESIIVRNNLTREEVSAFINKEQPWLPIHVIYIDDMPLKHGGVGMARKIGMDEAVRRMDNDGIILCLDADCAVDKNYLVSVESHFKENKNINGCSIYYEHPISGPLSASVYLAIAQYELHLRYFVDMQRRLKLPYAFHTVGSSMAVVSRFYQQVGGMNKRKAGEDFYFIQKLIKQGKFSNCTTTRVVPSPRISDRVPFGTGKAMKDILSSDDNTFFTYHPDSFSVIEDFVQNIIYGYDIGNVDIPDVLGTFISQSFMDNKYQEFINNTTTKKSFEKRMYQWFDAFMLMKALHFLRDNGYPLIPIFDAVKLCNHDTREGTIFDALEIYRLLDEHSSI